MSALTHNLLSSFLTLNSIRIRWGPVLRLVPCVEGNGWSVANAYMQIFLGFGGSEALCRHSATLSLVTLSVNGYVHETLFS